MMCCFMRSLVASSSNLADKVSTASNTYLLNLLIKINESSVRSSSAQQRCCSPNILSSIDASVSSAVINML